MKNSGLSSEDSLFFALVADAIFTNPFSTGYEEIARKLSDVVNLPPKEDGKRYHEVVAEVLEQRLAKLKSAGIQRIDDAPQRDRKLLEYAFLFSIYYRNHSNFEELIREQEQQGEKPVPVPFADQVLEEMTGYGIEKPTALKYFSLLYQLRRAFHFIDHALVGQSPCMKQLRHALWNNVFTNDIRIYGHHLWNRMEDFSTLLLGDTGTGKGTAAAAIGKSAPIPFDLHTGRFAYSFTSAFIATNLSQFPESLIESELFGHRKGAFTGAIDNHQGIFERCLPHGTLLLDEIGDVSLPTQIKLLNVLQERTFTPVGSHKTIRFEGRVIAATNRSIDQLRLDGQFRDDFYYRLCSDVIEVPSLATRIQEMPKELERLTNLLIKRMTADADVTLQKKVIDSLRRDIPQNYTWPGNVRELEQAVRRVILNGSYIPQQQLASQQKGWLEELNKGEMSIPTLTAHYCRMLYDRFGTYEEVSRRTGLDRRTAKKYVLHDQN